MWGVECGGLGVTGIKGMRGAEPFLGVTKGLPYQSNGKKRIVGRGSCKLSFVQAKGRWKT